MRLAPLEVAQVRSVMIKLLFSIPFVGSLTVLLSYVLIFVLSLVLLGYTISTVSHTQMQAAKLTFFFFLPSLMLSGFLFPFLGMSGWTQALGEIFPLTYFLRIVWAVMLKGAGLSDITGKVYVFIFFVLLFASLVWQISGSKPH